MAPSPSALLLRALSGTWSNRSHVSADLRRIPSLDGLRAFAILLVLLTHLSGTVGFPQSIVGVISAIEPVLPFRTFGVRVFFVISGYLITRLLLVEQARYGAISLKRFYLRRAFRIFPAGYLYVAVILICSAAGLLVLKPGDAVAALSYTMNYHHDRAWPLGHLWSLSVEEQFYLCWPALLIFFGAGRAAKVAVAMMLIAPVARIISIKVPELRQGLGETFPTIADSIAAGCFLAAVRERLWAREKYRAFLASPVFVIVPLLALACNALPLRYQATVGETVLNLAIALTIERTVRYSEGVSGRVLNWRPLVFIGGLSYSLYLWQQPFIDRTATGTMNAFPLNVALGFACALASYYLVEQPMLRLRARIEQPSPTGVQ